MSKKLWLIIGVVCVIIGGSLFSCVMGILDWDFNKLSTVEYETKTKEITDGFKNIRIDGGMADIAFEATSDNICRVVYMEEEKYSYNVYVENNTINILLVDTREWVDYINISNSQPQITVYLPQNQFEDIDLKNSTGDITLGNMSCSNMSIEGSTGDVSLGNISCNNMRIVRNTGDVTLSNISCDNMCIEGSTSDINLNNVIALKKLSVSVSTGDTVFNGCDAEEIYVSCSTGDISGTLLSEKVFTATVSTGDVSLPDTNSGGSCKLITSTGDINIKIK